MQRKRSAVLAFAVPAALMVAGALARNIRPLVNLSDDLGDCGMTTNRPYFTEAALSRFRRLTRDSPGANGLPQQEFFKLSARLSRQWPATNWLVLHLPSMTRRMRLLNRDQRMAVEASLRFATGLRILNREHPPRYW